ncbi:MAG TPA: hypothetical protein VNA23_08620 [Anaerolineales bacterium]|nr:hypothetical protein [Anaerolineales bacterium]
MDNSIHEQGSGTQDRQIFLPGRLILNGIMNWLLSLIKLTKEEQQEAGIYPGRLGDK